MSTSKKAKHSSRFPMGVPDAMKSYVCRLSQPFVAQSIQKDPSSWEELTFSEAENPNSVIDGVDIQLPVLGNEYIVNFATTEAGSAFCIYFLTYLTALASARIFHPKGSACTYLCTDASDEAMVSVLSLTRQAVDQRIDPTTRTYFTLYKGNEF